MHAKNFPRLLAHVGATTVSFGSQFEPAGAISHVSSYPCAHFETLWDAICQHRFNHGLEPARETLNRTHSCQ
jgi:glucokinase